MSTRLPPTPEQVSIALYADGCDIERHFGLVTMPICSSRGFIVAQVPDTTTFLVGLGRLLEAVVKHGTAPFSRFNLFRGWADSAAAILGRQSPDSDSPRDRDELLASAMLDPRDQATWHIRFNEDEWKRVAQHVATYKRAHPDT